MESMGKRQAFFQMGHCSCLGPFLVCRQGLFMVEIVVTVCGVSHWFVACQLFAQAKHWQHRDYLIASCSRPAKHTVVFDCIILPQNVTVTIIICTSLHPRSPVPLAMKQAT